MSNGSETPPTADHPQVQQITHNNNINIDAAKFVFPQNAIPISPGLFGSPTFFSACGTNVGAPITPTFLTPAAVGFSEPYFRAQGPVYSPFALAPPAAIHGALPKTPTLPPPSPHAIVGGALPTSATLVNSPFGKCSSFMEEFTKIGSISPFIMSPGPGLSPTRKANGTTVFFPTTITANGEAKLTTFINGVSVGHSPDRVQIPMDEGSRPSSTNSGIIKMEASEPPPCCMVDKDSS